MQENLNEEEFDKYIDDLIEQFAQNDEKHVRVDYFDDINNPKGVTIDNSFIPQNEPIREQVDTRILEREDTSPDVLYQKKIEDLELKVLKLQDSLMSVQVLTEDPIKKYEDKTIDYQAAISKLEEDLAASKKVKYEMSLRLNEVNSLLDKRNDDTEFLEMQKNLSDCEVAALKNLVKDLRNKNKKLANLTLTAIKEKETVKKDFYNKKSALENKIKDIINLVNNN